MPEKKEIYCYETKQKFESISKASKFYKITLSLISKTINNPNKTAGNFHWCTNLSIFDNKELKTFEGNSKIVYCYETKERFESQKEASIYYNLKDSVSIGKIINNPNATASGYHWCDNLSVFDGKELSGGVNSTNKKEIYCYETKQKFNSITEAANFYKLKQSTPINICLNNPIKTSCGYHWCSDLSIFDNVKLKYKYDDNISSYELEIVKFLKENNISNIIISDRKILGNKQELDIYLPDYNLAIEFNGDYWHSLAILSKKHENPIIYHQDKVLSCLENGVELISIFEFQYNNDKELYKQYILDRINEIDRSDLELESDGSHNLQFCNKKYFTECYEILEPQLMNHYRLNIYDCGKLIIKGNYE